MRLICGVLSFESKISGTDLLIPMCEAMQSPTRRAMVSMWTDGPAALAVMDFSRNDAPPEAHPIPRNGSFALAIDIRLDNQDELRNTLDLPNAASTDLAFHAFEKWGADTPSHLLGDFALACFNRREHTLTLARDIFGIRPIAYHHQPGRHVVFASFPRGLFPSGLVPRDINPVSIARQIQLRFPAEDTLFRNIHMVSPAHTIAFSRNGERTQRYWRPQIQPCSHKSPDSAAEELRSLLDKAVRCRMSATGAVAAHLSGGLDSSTIVTLASLALRTSGDPRAVHGFSFWPEERPEFNLEYERPFVESVLAKDPTIICHRIPAEPSGLWMTAHLHPDRILPLSDNNPENAICMQAAALGADSILSGWGGDEGATFNGRGVMAQSLLTLRWNYIAHEMKALRATRGWSKMHVAAGEILPFIIPDAARSLKDRLIRRQRMADERWRDLLQPAVTHAIAMQKKQQSLSMGPSARHNQLALLRSGHLSWKATMWATAGAHYGVGFAFPMLDRRVVDFTLSMPAQWHLRDGYKRRLIRDATEGLLPDTVRWRHNKIVPYPQFVEEMPEQRDDIVNRVRELAALAAVRAIFRVDQLLALAEAVPTAEQARSTPSSASAQTLVTLSSVIACCNFLIQNM